MFLDEARLSMRLRNSNIVQVYDVAEADDKTCYMVMEYVEGLDVAELSARLRESNETMPDSIVAFIIGEVLKGLAHAHNLRHRGESMTIVHRDVSPHNVMLSIFGEVKIMDFGIARVASEDTSGIHVKGKLRYMPPEQLRGETREPTIDLFAVGAMLHELLDGTKFRSNVVDEARLFGIVLEGEIPKLERDPRTIPPELDALRRSLLAARAEDRVQSAREAFQQLSQWSGYQDTRFELDELVRRHVFGERSQPPSPNGVIPSAAKPKVAKPRPGSKQESSLLLTVAMPAPTRARASLVGAELDADAVTCVELEGTVTNIVPIEETNQVPRAARPASRNARRRAEVVVVALIVAGIGLAGQSIRMILGSSGDDAVSATLAAGTSADATRADDTTSLEANVDELRLDLGPKGPELEAVTAAGDVTSEDGSGGEPPSHNESVTETKVSVGLGAGVPWAEIRIAGRRFEFDSLGKTSASLPVKRGSQRISYRLQFEGTWKRASVTIPAHPVTISIEKSGKVSVKPS